MTIYTVITDNGGGENQIYHDVEGEIYTFPKRYQIKLLPGTKVIYHRNKKTASSPEIPTRMLDASHYFGVAEIGDVQPTTDGNLRATIVKFKRFTHPVEIHKADGTYYEENPFWQQGVRSTNKEVYDSIVAASRFSPIVPPKKASRTVGIRTTTVLNEGIESKPFCGGKYKVVTGEKGYFLKNLSDGIYYELARVSGFFFKEGTIKTLKSSSGVPSFAVFHDSINIGVFDQIENGLRFKGHIDGKDIDINLLT